eukprot:gene138-1843_t
MAGVAWLAVMPVGGMPWERVGPYNIFDGQANTGEAGTLADA